MGHRVHLAVFLLALVTASGRVYVNIEDQNAVDVIDVKTHTVIAHWPVAPAEGPTGMAIQTAAAGARPIPVPESFHVLVYAPR